MLHTSTQRLGALQSGWIFNPRRGNKIRVDSSNIVPTFFGFMKNRVYTRPTDDDFNINKVVDLAIQRAGLTSASVDVPDLMWWDKLCKSAAGKQNCSNYGRYLLHRKIVHFLSERLGVEAAIRHDQQEVEGQKILDPIFLIGLPRAGNHVTAHVLGRSGVVNVPTMKDTMFPSKMSYEGRGAAYRKEMRFFNYSNPDFAVVRDMMGPHLVDDDIALQLQTPYSLAWGLLHGLDDFLLECVGESQDGVYAHERRILQLFQFYKKLGQYEDAVYRESNPIDNMLQHQREGYKAKIDYQPFCIHSPLAILHLDSLYKSFGLNEGPDAAGSSARLDLLDPSAPSNSISDLNLLWCHRSLPEALGSLCSSLAVHNSLYTGKGPSETQMGVLGEKVCGIFGSGTENAIDFLSTFPQHRLLNVACFDSGRSTTRIVQRILKYFGHNLDKWRKMQAIDGQTEYSQYLTRPHHAHKLSLFGLHEGIVAEHFDAYCFQFQEYAFMELPGTIDMRNLSQSQREARSMLNNPGTMAEKHIMGQTKERVQGHNIGAGPGAKDDAPSHMLGH